MRRSEIRTGAPGAALAGERRRLLFAGLLFVLCGATVLWRAARLQLIEGERLRRAAEAQSVREFEILPRRGTIFDRNTEILALTPMLKSLSADPAIVKRPDEVAAALGPALGLDEAVLRARLRGGRRFIWVKRFLSDEEARRLAAMKIGGRTIEEHGLRFDQEGKRVCPRGSLAAQLIGFTGGNEGRGLEGIELQYDAVLRGRSHSREGLRDALGGLTFMGSYLGQGEESGGSVRLTIDSRIQHAVEEALVEGARKAHARRGGMAVVLDPRSGEVLAMASEPTFDLNAPRREAMKDVFSNRVVGQLFEPGSSFKTATFASALMEEKITPSTMIDCDPQTLAVGGPAITDMHKHGILSASDVLRLSSNVGTAKIQQMIGWSLLRKHLREFGFGEETGVGLRSERAGRLPPQKAVPRDAAAASFGYGVSVNLLGLAAFYASIANGGVMKRPHLVSQIAHPDGKVTELGPFEVRRVMPERTAATLVSMLEWVVLAGTGTAAAVSGYRVGGKTGTSWQMDEVTKGYSKDDQIVSFVGFVPADAPRAVIGVVLEQPPVTETGGSAAAPVFARIAEATMRILGVAPTAPAGLPKVASAEDRASFGEDGAWFTIELPPELHLAADSMPDLTGMPARKLLHVAALLKLDVEMDGSGIVASQEPDAGGSISASRKISVKMKEPDSREEGGR